MGSGTSDLQELRFDDLTAPLLTDIQRQILDYTESREVTSTSTRMLAEAVAEAGVDDFADDDGFVGSVAAYVGAIEADDGLTQLIRGSLRATRRAAAAQPAVADRTAQAAPRDRGDPDRAAA